MPDQTPWRADRRGDTCRQPNGIAERACGSFRGTSDHPNRPVLPKRAGGPRRWRSRTAALICRPRTGRRRTWKRKSTKDKRRRNPARGRLMNQIPLRYSAGSMTKRQNTTCVGSTQGHLAEPRARLMTKPPPCWSADGVWEGRRDAAARGRERTRGPRRGVRGAGNSGGTGARTDTVSTTKGLSIFDTGTIAARGPSSFTSSTFTHWWTPSRRRPGSAEDRRTKLVAIKGQSGLACPGAQSCSDDWTSTTA